MLGRKKLTKFFITFLFISSIILFVASIAIFFMLTIININLFPLFLNRYYAFGYEFLLSLYVGLICITCYLCIQFTSLIKDKKYHESIEMYIKYGICSISLILVTYFLCISILENKTVVFKVFNSKLVEKKLNCSFTGDCEKKCLDELKFIYRGFILRMYYLQLVIFLIVSVNLAIATLLLIDRDENIIDEEGLDSLRRRYSRSGDMRKEPEVVDVRKDPEPEEGGGFHKKKPKKKK